jgi:hypothetical protein
LSQNPPRTSGGGVWSRRARPESRRSTARPRSINAPTQGGPGAIASLAGELDSAGIAIEDLGLRQPTLDDVFLTLTGTPAGAHAAAAVA